MRDKSMKKSFLKKYLNTAFLSLMGLSITASLTACNRFANPDLIAGLSPTGSTGHMVKSNSIASAYVPGQVVVQFRANPDPMYLQQFAQQNNLQVLRVSPMGSVLFQQMGHRQTGAVMQSLSMNSQVEYTHQNTLYRSQFTVNDPRSSEQSGLAVIGMGKAWDVTMGDPSVIIAVIDSGADLQHPDLAPNLVSGYNVLTQGQTPPQDDNGHGTHASGIAAAVADNNVGVAGTCPRCKLMPIKALDSEGAGTGFDVALAVVWAVDNGASVINMSLGGETSDPTLERAVKYALSHNVSVVVAAGNESTDTPMYPAALPGVIAVGSVDVDRQRSSFSNYGNWVSVMAPGKNILSTMPMQSVFMTSTEGYYNEYDFMDGTSMASPMVAGVVGLIKSRYPQLNPFQIKSRLEGTAIDLGAPGFDPEYANGMVDAFRAVL